MKKSSEGFLRAKWTLEPTGILSLWEKAQPQEPLTKFESFLGVKLEQGDGRAPDRREAPDEASVKRKMLGPMLLPGVEESQTGWPESGSTAERFGPLRGLQSGQARARFSRMVSPPCWIARI